MNSKRHKMQQVFSKIGQESGLALVLEHFYKKMQKDILIGFFFLGKDIHHIAEQQKKFLMRAWGVSSEYLGKPPATAHLSMPPILEGHFDRRLVLLRETLAETQPHLSTDEVDDWIAFEEGFRKILVK